jgi:hypothetical protein
MTEVLLGRSSSAGVGSVEGEDAVAPIGLGDEANCRRVGVQPERGEALSGDGRLDGDSPAPPGTDKLSGTPAVDRTAAVKR